MSGLGFISQVERELGNQLLSFDISFERQESAAGLYDWTELCKLHFDLFLFLIA